MDPYARCCWAITVVQHSQIHIYIYHKYMYPKYIQHIYCKCIYPKYISICANWLMLLLFNELFNELSATPEPWLSCNIPKYIQINISRIYTPNTYEYLSRIYPKYISQIYTPQILFQCVQTNRALLPSHDCHATFPNTYKCIPQKIHSPNIFQVYTPNICTQIYFNMCAHEWSEVGGWGRVPFSRNSMSPTPRRKWYLTTGRRAH